MVNSSLTGANLRRTFERIGQQATRWAGSSGAFASAVIAVALWLASGPLFGFSNTWLLIIGTITSIVTFLMVFLIQRTQNKESLALQLKLNEIVAALEGASNRLVAAEALSEDELGVLHGHYKRLAESAQREPDIRQSRSVDEAPAHHDRDVSEAD